MTDDLRIRIARELTTIVQLYGDLHVEALHRPPNSGNLYIPGGDALNMLGPAANLEAWEHRYETAEAAGLTLAQDYAYDQVDHEDHPLLVLASWEDVLRDERGQPTDLRATVQRAADYIRGSLDWMLGTNKYGDLNFLPIDALANDLTKVRLRLESVLHDGAQIERTRVTCTNPECETQPRLEKVYGSKVAWDRYQCRACRTNYDWNQYLLAKAQNLRKDGTERFVLVIDAMLASEVPKPTMRSWMRRGDVRTVCDLATRRLLVWWPDVRERAEQRRQRRDAS